MKVITFIMLSLSLLLMQGCQMLGDGPGRTLSDEEIAAIPDAVPIDEPLSELGNNESYEINGRRYNVMKDATGFVQHGVASWYGKKFHGRRTSNGESYDMYKMTAAHKTLPLPTYVRVTNLASKSSVVVRVNDRGPFIQGRAIDLSYVAAKKLGVLDTGTAEVEIRALKPGQENNSDVISDSVENMQPLQTTPIPPAKIEPAPPQPIIKDERVMPTSVMQAPATTEKNYYLQVGAFRQVENAQRLEQKMQQSQEFPVDTNISQSSSGPVYRIRIGPFYSRKDMLQVQDNLQQQGHTQFRQVME